MNNKILVTICVPVLEKKYDVFIPVSKTISVVCMLLTKSIYEITDGYFPKEKKCMLLSKEGKIYDYSKTLKDCGIKNADILILI